MKKLKALLVLLLLLPALNAVAQSGSDTGGTVVEGAPSGSGGTGGGTFTGGQLTSPLLLSEDPGQPTEAVTLRYLNSVLLPLQNTLPNVILSTGGQMTGNLLLPDGSPAASQLYVTNHGGGGSTGVTLPSATQVIAGRGDGTGVAMPEKGVTVNGSVASVAWSDDLKAGIYDPRDTRWAGGIFGPTPWLAAQAMSNQMACDLAMGVVKHAVAKWPQGAFQIDQLVIAPGSDWEGVPLADGGTNWNSKYNNHQLAQAPGSMTLTCSDGQSHTDSNGGTIVRHFSLNGCANGICTNAPGDTTNYVSSGPYNTGLQMGSTAGVVEGVYAQYFGGYGLRVDGQDTKAFHNRIYSDDEWYYYGGYQGVTDSAPSPESSATTTGTTGSVALSWPAVSGANGYMIYKSTSSGNETYTYATTATSFTDTCSNTGTLALNNVLLNSLATPGTITATPSTTGGTCAAGTYYYRIEAYAADGWHGAVELVGADVMADWLEVYGLFDNPTLLTYHHLADILAGGGDAHFDHMWPQLGQVGIVYPKFAGPGDSFENVRVDFARLEGMVIEEGGASVHGGQIDGSCTGSNAATINTGQEGAGYAGQCNQLWDNFADFSLDDVWFFNNGGFGPTYKTADIMAVTGPDVNVRNIHGASFQNANGQLQAGGKWDWNTDLNVNVTVDAHASYDIHGAHFVNPNDSTPVTVWAFDNVVIGQDFWVKTGNSNVTLRFDNTGGTVGWMNLCAGHNINLGQAGLPPYLHFMTKTPTGGNLNWGSVYEVCSTQPLTNLATGVTGQLSLGSIAAQSANTLLGAISNTSPTALPIPSCSGANNALNWTTGVGFSCATVTGGSGTTVNTQSAVSHFFLSAFNASTGNFSTAQPASTDLSDNSSVVHTSGNYTLGGNLVFNGVTTLSDGSPAASQQYVANAISGLSGGGTTTTNQQLATKTTSASAWNKICTPSGGQNNTLVTGGTTVACGGTSGDPVSVSVNTKMASPVLNNVGATNVAATYGLTTNATAERDILVPTTVSTNYQATVFQREQWFEGGSNLAGLSNYENDTYMFDNPDGWDFMMGFQCNRFNTGFWQIDNFKHGWQNTTVPCSIVAGHVYHWILKMHRDPVSTKNCTQPSYTYTDGSGSHTVPSQPAPCEYWDTFQLDDVTASTTNTYTLNMSLNAELALGRWVGWTGIGSQIQLDVVDSSASAGSPQLVSMNVDDDSLTTYVPVTSSGGSTTVTENVGNLGEYDFDTSTPTAGLTITGSPSLDNSSYGGNPAYTNPNAALFNAATEYYTAPISPSASTIYLRAEVQVDTSNTNSTRIFEGDNGSSQLWNLFFTATTGGVTFFNQATNTSTSCGSALSTGSYHRVEVQWTEGPATGTTTGSFSVLVDGTQTCSVTNVNTGSSPVTNVKFGEISSPATPWVFDIDNMGISSSGFLGAVTVGTSNALYDAYGAAAAVQALSLQASNNLSDVPNGQTALSNLLNNPAPGNYTVNCVSATSCTYTAAGGNGGAEVVSFSATPTFSTSVRTSRSVLTSNVTTFTLGVGNDGQEHVLCWQQGAGPYTVTPPSNVHGFAPVGSVNGAWSCQNFTYDATDAIWLSTSPGVINQ